MDASQMLPKLFVGMCPTTPDDIDLLRSQFGISAVLNVQTEDDFAYWGIDWESLSAHYQQAQIALRRVPVRDFDPDHLRRQLPACVEALCQFLDDGHCVYVHCSAGMNRSPSTVVAYLHWILQWDLETAVAHVTTRRSCGPYVEAIRLASLDRASGKPSEGGPAETSTDAESP